MTVPSDRKDLVRRLTEGTEVLRTGGGAHVTAGECGDLLDVLAVVERYENALRWYADENNWTQPASWGGRLFDSEAPAVDCGKAARAALAGTEEPA